MIPATDYSFAWVQAQLPAPSCIFDAYTKTSGARLKCYALLVSGVSRVLIEFAHSAKIFPVFGTSAKVSISTESQDYSTVALDKADNLILFSVLNETVNQMLLQLEESSDLTLVRRPHAFRDVENHWTQEAIALTVAYNLFQVGSEPPLLRSNP